MKHPFPHITLFGAMLFGGFLCALWDDPGFSRSYQQILVTSQPEASPVTRLLQHQPLIKLRCHQEAFAKKEGAWFN